MANDNGKQENRITEKIVVEQKYTNAKISVILLSKNSINNLICSVTIDVKQNI